MAQCDPQREIPQHRPVMVAEVLQALDPKPGERALDLTLGTGGHALAVGQRLGRDGLLVGLDADRGALALAGQRLGEAAHCPVKLFHGRFSQTAAILSETGFEGFNAILADLGVGSHQMDDPERGFSFQSEARLDMRFDTSGDLTAWEVVNKTPEVELADLFYQLGQERHSRRIADEICRCRASEPIDTPAQLSQLVKRVVARHSRGRTWRIHPATRVAMALRIFVNDELAELDCLLETIPSLLAQGGRAAILTYHSLEARRVKYAWRSQQREGLLEPLTRRVVKPSEAETDQNPRARSAQLRAVRRI